MNAQCPESTKCSCQAPGHWAEWRSPKSRAEVTLAGDESLRDRHRAPGGMLLSQGNYWKHLMVSGVSVAFAPQRMPMQWQPSEQNGKKGAATRVGLALPKSCSCFSSNNNHLLWEVPTLEYLSCSSVAMVFRVRCIRITWMACFICLPVFPLLNIVDM